MLEAVTKIVKMHVYNELTDEYELRNTQITAYYPVNESSVAKAF